MVSASILLVIGFQCLTNSWTGVSALNPSGRIECPADNGAFPAVEDACVPDFYTCIDGVPYPDRCPGNLVFDPNTLNCAQPESCSITTTTIRTTTPLSFDCPSPNGFFAIPNKCSSDYFLCIGNIPYIQTCPLGPNGEVNVFDPITSVCTPPVEASCFSCPKPDGFFPVPGSCGPDYYVCVSDSPFIQTCPDGTVFDPVTLQCTPLQLSSCDDSTSEFKCPSPDGRYPVSDAECSGNYYTCINNISYPTKCPGSSVFDPVELVCVLEEDASCVPTIFGKKI